MKNVTGKSALLALLAIAALLSTPAANAAPLIYATIDGSRQGVLRGDAPLNDSRDKTTVMKFAYSVTAPASGRRQHGPVRITKEVGPASPQLLQALVTNENIKSVVIDFLTTNSNGELSVANSIRILNAKVVGIEQFTEELPANGPNTLRQRNLETISFTFQTIEMSSPEGKTTAMDSLTAP